MDIVVSNTAQQMGGAAAACGAKLIRSALAARGSANIIVATGASQFTMFDALVASEDLDWSKVTGFHLDEYIGLSADHPASFRRYLKERLVERVPLAAFHYVEGDVDGDGDGDPQEVCRRLGELIARHPIDVAFVGIGENGHLAFNDPPADFETEDPYLVVDLDEACRRQQLGEGWFETLDDVPRQAISMSIQQILTSAAIVCTVPDQRKAEAVRAAAEGPITNLVPASILQSHACVMLFLDAPSALLLASLKTPPTP